MLSQGFPGGLVIKNPVANAGDAGFDLLIWEDPTRWGAMKPMNHSYWACALGLGATTTEAHVA